jgi:hypothetical protein
MRQDYRGCEFAVTIEPNRWRDRKVLKTAYEENSHENY